MNNRIRLASMLAVLLLSMMSSAVLARSSEAPKPTPAPKPADFSAAQKGYNGTVCPMVGIGQLVHDEKTLAALTSMAAPAPCINGLSNGVFPCDKIDLQSFVSLDQLRQGASAGSALWGFKDLNDGREYAVVGVYNGVSVVDVTDAVNPRVVGSIGSPASSWREIKVYQYYDNAAGRWKAYAYAATEASAGMQIIDLTGLPNSVSLAATYLGFETSHTLYMANVDYVTGAANVAGVRPVLYVEHVTGSDCGLNALDLSDPIHPQQRGCIPFGSSTAHDIYATVFSGARADAQCAAGHNPCEVVFNFIGYGPQNTLKIYDFTDKANPVLISQTTYNRQGYTHSGFGSTDDNYLFLQDELDELNYGGQTQLRVFDIHDIRSPALVSKWTGPTGAIEHNGFTLGNRYYLANYTRGLTVLDITNPLAPVQTAFFDTYPTDDSTNFHAAWHTYPYLPSGNILVSNIDGPGGLYVLREQSANPDQVYLLRARYVVASQKLQIMASSNRAPSCTLTAQGFGALTYNASRGAYIGKFSTSSMPSTVTVTSSCGGSDTQSVPYP